MSRIESVLRDGYSSAKDTAPHGVDAAHKQTFVHFRGNRGGWMRFGSQYAFEHMILLAPPSSAEAFSVGSLKVDASQHRFFLTEAQRLRGRVYLQDGAVDDKQLSRDGRLVYAHDEHSWHLLLLDRQATTSACVRYIPHQDRVSFHDLGVASSALAYSPTWGSRLRCAIQAERAKARLRGMGYAEVGGLALAEEMRYTTAALLILLNVYGLMKLLGGALAIS